MDPLDHLRDQVAPPGSNLHYSLLFAAPNERQILCAVAAWQQEARLLAFAPRERSATLARIDWWQEEALRLRIGLPRHPISIALAGGESPSLHAMGESVLGMLDKVQRLVLDDRVMEEQDLWQHCDALGSEGERMIAEALATPRRGAPGVIAELGRGLEMLELIRPPPGHRRITPRMVPLDRDEALGDDAGDGLRTPCSSAMRALLRERGERSGHLIREGLGRLAELPRPPERSRLVLARLALVQLGILAREGYRRWETGPSPLRKLWTAWRAAQRYS